MSFWINNLFWSTLVKQFVLGEIMVSDCATRCNESSNSIFNQSTNRQPSSWSPNPTSFGLQDMLAA